MSMNKHANPLVALYHESEILDGRSALPPSACEDLNLSELFTCVDYTSSAVGRQYLYNLLHVDRVSEVAQHENLIQRLRFDKELQHTLTDRLKKLNSSDAFSIASLFTAPSGGVSKRERRLIYYCRFLPFLSMGLIFLFQSPFFLFLFMLAFLINGILHYKSKRRMQEYFFSVPQLLLLLKQAEMLSLNSDFATVQKDIKEALAELLPLRKQLFLFKLGIRLESDWAILVYMIAEVCHVFFLSEAYAVSTALFLLEDKKKPLKKVYRFMGLLDTLNSVSVFRASLPYFCTPQSVNISESGMDVRSMYHPLIKLAVANDLHLGKKSILITGSNMSGKTSFIRTVGVNLLMAKALHTCCAEHFETSLDRRLFSAMYLVDDLEKGESFFLKEVARMKELLIESEKGGALFLLDEIFKGTNTVERIAIAKAVLSFLCKHGNMVLVSTHDLVLAELLEEEYEQYHFSEAIKDNNLFFNYRLMKGMATQRNAIRLLELYQYPKEVIRQAYTICLHNM